MKIIRAIVKCFLVIATILLLGQLSIGRNTVGGWFSGQVQAGWKAGSTAVQSSHWYGSVAELPLLSSWFKGPTPTPIEKERPRPPRLRHSKVEMEEDGEKITSADRESLIRLLE